MKEKEKKQRSNSRVRRRSTTALYVFCFLISIFIAFFYFYTEQKSIRANSDSPYEQAQTLSEIKSDSETQQPLHSSIKSSTESALDKGNSHDSSFSPSTILNDKEKNSIEGTSPEVQKNNLESIGTPSDIEKSQDISPTREKQENTVPKSKRLISVLNGFYEHLDQQQYMKDFHLSESSKTHFSKLLQKLFDTPPVVTNETDDLFTILKNTAHFFRILGKKNILVLKGILDREKSFFEEIIKTFYELTSYPDALEKEYGIVFTDKELYDYASFFQSTMGGRLYLFRRDSTSRMAISFYAVMIIDKANSEGYNRHGIDLRPAIDSLIEEMENTGKNLRYKEEYLDRLYDLKEKYS